MKIGGRGEKYRFFIHLINMARFVNDFLCQRNTGHRVKDLKKNAIFIFLPARRIGIGFVEQTLYSDYI